MVLTKVTRTSAKGNDTTKEEKEYQPFLGAKMTFIKGLEKKEKAEAEAEQQNNRNDNTGNENESFKGDEADDI
jgi:hypothetical protein